MVGKVQLDGYNFLNRIFSVFLKGGGQTLNSSQIASATGLNRHAIKGALEVLAGLGLVESVYQVPNNKLFRLPIPPNHGQALQRLTSLLPLIKYARIAPEDWAQGMAVLTPLVLAPPQARAYIAVLEEASPIALEERLSADYAQSKLGLLLPPLIRDRIVDLFYELCVYGIFKLPPDVLAQPLRTRAAAK